MGRGAVQVTGAEHLQYALLLKGDQYLLAFLQGLHTIVHTGDDMTVKIDLLGLRYKSTYHFL